MFSFDFKNFFSFNLNEIENLNDLLDLEIKRFIYDKKPE